MRYGSTLSKYICLTVQTCMKYCSYLFVEISKTKNKAIYERSRFVNISIKLANEPVPCLNGELILLLRTDDERDLRLLVELV